MNADKQGNYTLRKTNNYFDLIEGRNYHAEPLTFAEFLAKPESLFIYEPSFFQIPGYVQLGAEVQAIEDEAREYVVDWIIDQYENRLLGMQDYVRWAKLFKNKCDSLAPSFWAQVNMIDLMYAKDLETDENVIERQNTGNRSVTGTGATEVVGHSKTSSTGSVETTQDIDNTQSTDTSTREANATVIRAEDQLTDNVEYNWANAADNVHEIRNRSGDSHQHMHSVSASNNDSTADSTTTTTRQNENTAESSGGTSTEHQQVTNKQFIQERQWSIATARDLLPLEWLNANLRGMFYLIY